MCYLVARNIHKLGSVAIRTNQGKELVRFKKELIQKFGYEDIQIMTISRPSGYSEYAPYRVVDTFEEFKEHVYQLCSDMRYV